MKPVIYTLVILVVILSLAFMFVDMRGLYHCSLCNKSYLGKQESLKDKPVCDECYEKKYVENYGKEKPVLIFGEGHMGFGDDGALKRKEDSERNLPPIGQPIPGSDWIYLGRGVLRNANNVAGYDWRNMKTGEEVSGISPNRPDATIRLDVKMSDEEGVPIKKLSVLPYSDSIQIATIGPVYPVTVVDEHQKEIFAIKENGDFILRSKKIANDKEVAERFMQCGNVFKEVDEAIE